MGKKIKSVARVVTNPTGAITRAIAPKLGISGDLVDPMGAARNMAFGRDSALGTGGSDGMGSLGLGYDSTGRPIAPGFQSLRDPATGQLKDIYKYDPTKSEAFSQLRGQALSTGPSAWANLQTQKQKLEQQNLADLANKQSLQAMGQSNAMLARTGGLSSGAARLAQRDASRNALLQGQEVARGGMLDRLGISQVDEDRRQQLLGKVADAETGAQQSNLGRLVGDVQGQSQFDLERYAQQMQEWGAGKTAAAQQAAAAQTRKGKK